MDECADDPEVVLVAPLAATTLTAVAPLDVSLGQGFTGELVETGESLSKGCVTGKETNESIHFGTDGTSAMASGGVTLGVLRDDAPEVLSFARPAHIAPYVALVAENEARSLYWSRSASLRIRNYFLLNEKRATAPKCGDHFVRNASPSRTMAVTFQVTFPTAEERGRFRRCFPENESLLAQADAERASRYLIAHGASLGIHVLRAAGDMPSTQQILAATQCSAANLSACVATLEELEQQIDDIGMGAPPDTLPLAEVTPSWGIFSVSLTPYTIFPD